MKKNISSFIVVMCFFLVFGLVGNVSAAVVPKIFVDGNNLKSDVDPVIIQGTTLVPLAVLSTGLGYGVKWDQALEQVTVTDDDINIVLTIGQKIGLVNNESYELALAPIVVKGRTMVPLRFVTEILGFKLQWKQAEKEIYLTSPVKVPEITEPTVPAVQTGTVTGVTVDADSTIHINYTGSMNEPTTMLLTSPNRLVIDLPDTSFTYDLANSFIKGQTEVTLDGFQNLTGYRYSIFSNNPLKARFVVLFNEVSKYEIVKTDTEVKILIGDTVGTETPTPSPTPTPTPTPTTPPVTDPGKDVYHIVLDAGHGKQDPGFVNSKLGLFEKTFNLSAVLKIKAELEKNSKIVVHLTRSDDTFLELNERVAFAEKIPGLNKKADIFISVHANGFTTSSPNGTETYYSRANSKKLAEIIHPRVLAAVGLNDRGVKTAGFRVIKDTTMPAILLEVGFMSNDNDAKVIFNEAIQKKLAVEVAAGVKEYLNLK
ncbi:N-acetylmuramoyl-L-alanine amidase [Paenibacillus endoradicis]|uniref:N-acetylmuramoyl-L-alanine amidase n=1 Tax=Paenibacillus endoradicis TaxID=2972487 RepID=UPI00215910A6|nr:N-acetylmuramoyl-L-alanine amidase [Paenibacillus endoradicis]MCR8660628.1 N-acetylmuramoyl-L-alanine amidase [Paenibacillus endoradicis]